MAKKGTGTKRKVVQHDLEPSKADGQWITPYSYAKKKSTSIDPLRPQVVYQWVLKQGCPAKDIAGKIYVNEKEVDEWLGGRDERKKQRQQAAAKKAEANTIPTWLVELLSNAKLNRAEAWCENCQNVTEWYFGIEWTDLDYTGPYKTARCDECHLNMREYPIEKDRAIAAMKKELTLRVPKRTSLVRLDNEQWQKTTPDATEVYKEDPNEDPHDEQFENTLPGERVPVDSITDLKHPDEVLHVPVIGGSK